MRTKPGNIGLGQILRGPECQVIGLIYSQERVIADVSKEVTDLRWGKIYQSVDSKSLEGGWSWETNEKR